MSYLEPIFLTDEKGIIFICPHCDKLIGASDEIVEIRGHFVHTKCIEQLIYKTLEEFHGSSSPTPEEGGSFA